MIWAYLNRMAPRELYLALGSALFLLLTALVMLVAKPLYLRWDQTVFEIRNLSALEEPGHGPALAPLEDQVAHYESLLRGELQDIPLRQLESHIIGALQNSAWQSDVKLLNIEPQEVIEGLPYQEVAFRLEVEGQYYPLDQWMMSVSQQLGFVVFKEYTLRVLKPGENPVLRGRVLLAAYRTGPD